MAIPTLITELSTTAASNPPAGSESPTDGDNHLRAAYSFIAKNYAEKAPLASPTFTGVASFANLPTVGGNELGYRSLLNSRTVSGGGTTIAADNGLLVIAGGNMNFNAGEMPVHSIVSICNPSANTYTLYQASGMVLRLAGTTKTGDLTLGPQALVTCWWYSSQECFVSGAGVS